VLGGTGEIKESWMQNAVSAQATEEQIDGTPVEISPI
jgi:hypothetical protein